jgi:hypothetical protein
LTTLSINGLDKAEVVFVDDECGYLDRYDSVRHLIKKMSLKGWDISHITSMSYIISGFWRLEQLDLSGWDISILESKDLYPIISQCYSLYKINLKDCSFSTVETILKYSYLPQDYEGTDLEGKVSEGTIYVDEEIFNNPPSIDIGNWKYEIATDWSW